MPSISRCLGTLLGAGLLPAALLAGACGDGSVGNLFPGDAGIVGPPLGQGGRGGRGGLGGRGGTNGGGAAGSADDAGVAGSAGEDAGEQPVPGECQIDDDCADGNFCTEDTCNEGRCESAFASAGTECGDTTQNACTFPDACNDSGVCLPNHAPNGTECDNGSCTEGQCIEGQPAGCPAAVVATVPFTTTWRTVGGVNLYNSTGCNDSNNSPDFAVVFTAPSAGTYRFEASGSAGDDDPDNEGELADSVIAVVAGNCGGLDAAQLACDDDIVLNQNLDSRVDLALTEGQTVTVYAGELGENLPGGGSGSVTISLPDD